MVVQVADPTGEEDLGGCQSQCIGERESDKPCKL